MPGKSKGIFPAIRHINFLFLLLVFYEILLAAIAIGQHRVPAAHDGFLYFSLQYYFLNNAVFTGEVPAWIPYLTHGIISSWWYFIQAGLFQNILCLIAPLLKSINFIPLFHIGILLDKLLLLSGTWLLAKRLFGDDITTFFVSFTVSASTIWMTQPWFNFHFFYAVPMILYLLHRFLDTRQWRYPLLAGTLLILQSFGNPPYLIAFTSFVIFLYMFSFLFFHLKSLRGLNVLSWRAAACCAIVLAGFAVTYYALSHGMDQVVNYGSGRGSHMHTTFQSFLHYGRSVDAKKWVELFLGVSPVYDYTIFIGFLPLCLIVPGLYYACAEKEYRHLPIVIVILLAVCCGFTPLLYLLYHGWPMMNYFRHLALTSPFVKLFLCFLAGVGFRRVFIQSPRSKTALVFVMFMSVLMLANILFMGFLTRHLHTGMDFLNWMVNATTSRLSFIRLKPSILLPAFEGLMLGAVQYFFLFIFYLVLRGYKKQHLTFIVLLLCLHIQGLSLYMFQSYHMRTIRLDTHMVKELNFAPVPYWKNRTDRYRHIRPRQDIINRLQNTGVFYWFYGAFTSADRLSTVYRTDYWMRPLDKYLLTYWGQDVNDTSQPPHGWHPYGNLLFPWSQPAALKISGATEDKIQFFSKAFTSPDSQASALMANARYKGDLLFVAPRGSSQNRKILRPWKERTDLGADQRLHLPYTVKRFDANNIHIQVTVPGHRPVFMMYADVWHPFWKATVNGKARTVFRADLAYKAVVLNPGVNNVSFSFHPRSIIWTSFLIGAGSLFWLAILLWIMARIIADKEGYSPMI